ncbi:helix-turn-helix domain-containing protein [Dendrosporobacter sp. 1207_IL3150]|uniref:helix-turn-helix domain-containing protein n=1 Tax=Dendrosporobacter sp. 1207_IL3150 TaxID=3084054 RepID=UPI002FD9D6AC
MQSVGDVLRTEREKKGLSIKDIEAATSIRALYLSAIEANDFKVIPGEVYVKGFIRNYANYLGLSGPNIVELYRQQNNSNLQVAPQAAATATEIVSTPASTQEDPEHKSNNTKWILLGLAIAAIAGVIWWISASKQTTPQQVPQQPSQNQNSTLPPSSQAAPTPTPAKSVTPQSKPISVTAKYNEECWTQVVADGKEIYEGIPSKNDSFTWEADKSLVVKVGNAGGVEIIHNGQSLGKLGNKGDVIVKSFAANQSKQ